MSTPPRKTSGGGFLSNIDQFFGGFFTGDIPEPEQLTPWEFDIPNQWIGREGEFEKYIKNISKHEYFFKYKPPKDFKIPLDKIKAQQIAKLALEKDINLKDIRMKLVPTHVSETHFWKCYFYFVYYIRNEKDIHLLDQKFEKIEKNLKEAQEIEIKQILIELEELENDINDMKHLLNDIIVKSLSEKKNPFSKEIEDKIEHLIQEKKKISFLLQIDLTDNDELMTKIVSLDNHFLSMMNEFDKYIELKKKKTEIKKEKDYFIPQCIHMKKECILNDRKRMELSKLVPLRFKQRNWDLIYSTFENGTLLNTMNRNMENSKGPFFIIILTTKQEILGCFLDISSLEIETNYYGGGETFVFNWNEKYDTIQKFKWTKKNDFLLLSNGKSIYVGGGVTSKPAIYISDDLLRGSTGQCDTFDSPPLTNEIDFEIFGIQVFSFEFKK
eukprot:gene2871-4714_t